MYIDLDYIKLRVRETDLIDCTREKDDDEVINEDRINAIIVDASSEFENAAIQGGYEVPISNCNEFIQRVIFDIFLYLLYARKYDDEEMKDVYVRHSKAFDKLNKIANKEILLNGCQKTNSVLPHLVLTNKVMSDRVFTYDNLH